MPGGGGHSRRAAGAGGESAHTLPTQPGGPQLPLIRSHGKSVFVDPNTFWLRIQNFSSIGIRTHGYVISFKKMFLKSFGVKKFPLKKSRVNNILIRIRNTAINNRLLFRVH